MDLIAEVSLDGFFFELDLTMIAAWLAWTQAIRFTIYAAHMLKISVLPGPKGNLNPRE